MNSLQRPAPDYERILRIGAMVLFVAGGAILAALNPVWFVISAVLFAVLKRLVR